MSLGNSNHCYVWSKLWWRPVLSVCTCRRQDFSLTGCCLSALWVQIIAPKPLWWCHCCHLQRLDWGTTLQVTQPRTTGTASQSLTLPQRGVKLQWNKITLGFTTYPSNAKFMGLAWNLWSLGEKLNRAFNFRPKRKNCFSSPLAQPCGEQPSPAPSMPPRPSTSCLFSTQPEMRRKTRLCWGKSQKYAIDPRSEENWDFSAFPPWPATPVSLKDFSALGLFAFLQAHGFGVSVECGFYRFPECHVHSGSPWELPRKGSLRERLEEKAQQESTGAQRGRCWEYFGRKVRLRSGKLQHTFQPNPLYLSVFSQCRALCSLEDSAPISEGSHPRMPGASLATNHRRRATNTTLTQVFHFFTTEAMHFSRDEWTYQLHSPIPTKLLRGTLFLAKVHLLSTPPALHTSPAHLSSPLPSISGLPQR